MNILDITILAIIIITTSLGLWKGMQKQVFGIGGIVAGYIAAIKLYEPVANLLGNDESAIAKVISFLAIFFLGKTVISYASWLSRNFFKKMNMTWLNRLGGAALGFLKGFIIVIIIVLVLLAFLPSQSGIITDSVILPYIASMPKISSGIIPEEIRNKYNNNMEKLKSKWEKHTGE